MPGAMGQQGPPGPQGVQGVQGPSGVLGISYFQGGVAGSVALVNTNFVFVGPVATIVTTDGQRVTASGAFSVGSAASVLLRVDMCARPSATPAANPTSIQTAYKVVNLQANLRTMFSPVSSYLPGAGSWHIGNCVAGDSGGTITLNHNDWSTGWVMVTN